MKKNQNFKKHYGHPDPALPGADKWAREARQARVESRPSAGLDLLWWRGQSAPTTWPARDAASWRSARGTRPRARAGRGWRAHEGLGVAGMLTRSTNGRSKVASGGTARGGGWRRPTSRGSCGEGTRPVRV
jgi:hypothetical protein